MVNHPYIRRVICAHSWSNVTEWATALDSLADCTDEELEALAKSGGGTVSSTQSLNH